MKRRTVAALTLTAAAAIAASGTLVAQKPVSSCVACHLEMGDEYAAPVEHWQEDVHNEVGLGCVGCHGGDPSPELAEDLDAMAPETGFVPAPDRLQIAQSCARCHSDITFMRRYDPQARVDQLSEYLTSAHGIANAAGDPKPATCTDCHGVHGIRRVDDPVAGVYPINVPTMCATCHADAELMAEYDLRSDPLVEYRHSVHGRALLLRRDTAAPACNDCHGNHGAAPPGVTSVANVCGQCHGRQATLFRDSIKKDLFDMIAFPECSGCHDHHLVRHPTSEFFLTGAAPSVSQGRVVETSPLKANLGPLPAGTEATLRWVGVLAPGVDEDQLGHVVRVRAGDSEPVELDAAVLPGSREETILRTAEGSGLALRLTLAPAAGPPVADGDAINIELSIRADAGASGDVVVQDVPGLGVHTVEGSICMNCHAEGDHCDVATGEMYDAVTGLQRSLRAASTNLHRAEIAGMEVREPQFELKSGGTTAVIEARALIHSFDPERVMARTAEGLEVVREADAAAAEALDELAFRHKGLWVSLVLIAVVLVALFLKIREVDRQQRESA